MEVIVETVAVVDNSNYAECDLEAGKILSSTGIPCMKFIGTSSSSAYLAIETNFKLYEHVILAYKIFNTCTPHHVILLILPL